MVQGASRPWRRCRLLASLLVTAMPGVAAVAQAGPPPMRLTRVAAPPLPGEPPLYPAGSIPPGTLPARWGEIGGALPDGLAVSARIARNVSVPSITPFLPDPAGKEGVEVARRLAAEGIAAFVLNYRTNPVPDDEAAFMTTVDRVMAGADKADRTRSINDPHAGPDALQALRLIRAGAARYRVDPARVGMSGFSAGEMTPMFAALAYDDPLVGARGIGLADAWHQAGRPVEVHRYERGGHGFAGGRPGTTTAPVLPEFVAWLRDRNLPAAWC